MEPHRGGPRVFSTATAVPRHRVEQREIKEFARGLFAGKFRDLERLLPIFDNGHTESGHFCRPPEWFEWERSFPERNALYVEHALELSEKRSGAAWTGWGRSRRRSGPSFLSLPRISLPRALTRSCASPTTMRST